MQTLIAKMAGGAQMFALHRNSDTMRIGPRNVSLQRNVEKVHNSDSAEDTGGNYGRTIEFDSQTGVLHIRSVQYGVKEI